jgi:hypothetical protein
MCLSPVVPVGLLNRFRKSSMTVIVLKALKKFV